MKIKISDIHVNPGRREATLEPVAELAKSIAAVPVSFQISLNSSLTG